MTDRLEKDASLSPREMDEASSLRSELEIAKTALRLQQQELDRARGDAEMDRIRYQELFARAPEAYLVTDINGTILESNEAASELFNTSRAALRHTPLSFFVHRDQLRDFVKCIVAAREVEGTAEFTQQFFPSDKAAVTTLVSVARTTSAQPQHTLRWIIRDVTEREKQREEIERLNLELESHVERRTRELQLSMDALARSEARLGLALDIETVGVVFFDGTGRITDCNAAFLRMVGYTRNEFESGILRWDKVTPREWIETEAATAREIPLSGRSEPYEREYFRKDGSRWWGLVAAQWLSEDEGVEFILDVSDRKRAEEELATAERAAELERSRRNLRRQLTVAEEQQRKRLARDLHDRLGQHLTAFALELEYARRNHREDPELQRSLERLAQITETMTQDARSLALELRPPELDDVGLTSAVETFLTQWTKRYGIPVDLEFASLDGRMPPNEQATTIYRILQEAMTNIARHASPSAVSVILERPDGEVRLIVEDNGSGFNVDEVMHRSLREHRYGLAGMRERVEIAGGELVVESTVGTGTTVFARLPVEERAAD